MKYVVTALAMSLSSTPVLAQATTPTPPTTAPASTTDTGGAGGASTATNRAGDQQGSRTGRGAYIKMQGPGGSEIAVRCADGESTRACADVVSQLLERARSGGSERRRDMDREMYRGERGDFRSRDRDY